MKPFEGYDPEGLYPDAMQSSLWNVSYQAGCLGEWLWTHLGPRSVIDVGCGAGCYLSVFTEHGCEVLGIDACTTAGTLIPGAFERIDLRLPYHPPHRFDLAICIEVAEHLEPQWADTLLDTLACCGDVLVFSAAVPGQPGQYHVNLQPSEYWLGELARRGYVLHPLDAAMRENLHTLRPSTPDQTDGRHSWLRDNVHLLQRDAVCDRDSAAEPRAVFISL